MQETGEDMPAALRRFGERGKLFNIHFRNVRGIIPRFEEVFQDEGDYNAADQMRTLHEVGFDGFVMPDHYPGLLGDNEARERARAWCVGLPPRPHPGHRKLVPPFCLDLPSGGGLTGSQPCWFRSLPRQSARSTPGSRSSRSGESASRQQTMHK